MRTLLPVVGCGNFVAKLVGVTYSNTFTPYEHTDVVAEEVVLALNAVLTVYNVFEMFIDAVAALVRNEPVDALVKNEPVDVLVRNEPVDALVRNEPVDAPVKNEPVDALVKNEPVDAFIASIEPVKYSKLPSNSSCVNGAPLVERIVKFAIV